MKPFPWRRGMTLRRPTTCGLAFNEGLLVQEVVTIRDGSTWLRWRQGGEEDPATPESRRSFMEQADGWLLADDVETDPNDGATKGALLDAVREAWAIPGLYPRRIVRGFQGTWHYGAAGEENVDGWGFDGLGFVKGDELARRVGIQPSEFAALLAAWEAAP